MNHLWLDSKYILLVAHRLRNFKRKNNNTMNMSCPFCGDSKTNSRKARGYIYERKGSMKYCCHNCGINTTIGKVIQLLDPGLYDEYIKERFLENLTPQEIELQKFEEKFEAPKFIASEELKVLKKVSSLRSEHPVKQWVDKRMIPSSQHYRLYFTKSFMQWTNTLLPEKFDEKALLMDEPRLVIPMLDADKNLLGFQGRSFKKKSSLRYITIMLNEEYPKLFGLDVVDRSKCIYVVEGPIDSLFLPNAIASAGADLTSNLDVISTDKSKFVLIFDREPRNKDMVKRVESAIERGYNVCLLPDSMPGKDINEYFLSGMSQENILKKIEEHTSCGLDALVTFKMWSKC